VLLGYSGHLMFTAFDAYFCQNPPRLQRTTMAAMPFVNGLNLFEKLSVLLLARTRTLKPGIKC
jgi:hypothetical protein